VGLIASLDAVASKKIPCSCRESNPCRPARSLVNILTALPWLILIVVRNQKAQSGASSVGVTFIPNFMKMCKLV
jgi:hypothetical protein